MNHQRQSDLYRINIVPIAVMVTSIALSIISFTSII